jgi:hypothetical protein
MAVSFVFVKQNRGAGREPAEPLLAMPQMFHTNYVIADCACGSYEERPRCRCPSDSNLHRAQVNIARQCQKTGIALDQFGLTAAVDEVAVATMPSIEIDRVHKGIEDKRRKRQG